VFDPDFNTSLKVVGICSVNREEWILTDLASNLLEITSIPLYETLGHQMLLLILKQTEMTTLFGNCKSLLNVLNMAEDESIFL
jgi:long-chain acyl-CoA synthetase